MRVRVRFRAALRVVLLTCGKQPEGGPEGGNAEEQKAWRKERDWERRMGR